MEIDRVLDWVQATQLAVAIRENEILFPWIESFHVLAIVLVVGTISMVDLRLLGLASRNRALTRVLREVLPYTWSAFAVAAITGSLLFSSNATKYAHNVFFQAKMMLLVIAAANMAIFHLIGARETSRGGAGNDRAKDAVHPHPQQPRFALPFRQRCLRANDRPAAGRNRR